MDDLDRLLGETLRDAAGRAPSDHRLLDTVHRQSRRYHRRRVVTWVSAAAAVVAVGLPFAVVQNTRPGPSAPPMVTAPAGSGPSPSAPGSAPAGALTLTGGWTAPTFPYALPATDGMTAPVISWNGGRRSAFYEATELRHHADIVVTVSDREPEFTTPATEDPMEVRGHAGILRTVDVRPARQLSLRWRESENRWIQLATDDTYTPGQIVALAESLRPASIAVLPPFDLALSPAGLITDTVTPSRMTFRRAGSAPGAGGFSTVLRRQRALTGINQEVNGYQAALTHHDGSSRLAVAVTDWDATLEVTVSNGLTISDSDLLRYATGVRILNRSSPE